MSKIREKIQKEIDALYDLYQKVGDIDTFIKSIAVMRVREKRKKKEMPEVKCETNSR